MAIGTAIFLVAVIYFAIAYPGFRRLLLVCAAIVGVLLLIAVINIVHKNRQNAAYRPASIVQPEKATR
jgi:uncharacterized membrane-anchored protein YitT (DUF2179 family)